MKVSTHNIVLSMKLVSESAVHFLYALTVSIHNEGTSTVQDTVNMITCMLVDSLSLDFLFEIKRYDVVIKVSYNCS